MKHPQFSLRDLIVLQGNPYTKSVSREDIEFTDQFYYMIVSAHQVMSPNDLFMNMGYDPQILGEQWIEDAVTLICKTRFKR